jgi:hypothetical protein
MEGLNGAAYHVRVKVRKFATAFDGCRNAGRGESRDLRDLAGENGYRVEKALNR